MKNNDKARTVARFMIVEAACFAIAAAVHAGVLFSGYEHRAARIAESVLAAVLFIGWISLRIRPAWKRRIGMAAQGFALIGTLVGVFTIIIGIGPRTLPDILYHAGMVALLIVGLAVAARARPS